MPSKPARRTLFIRTYGCQMNVYDSERIAELMRPLGYELGETPDEADLVILNTCHIREKATEKVYSELGKIRILKEARAASGREMAIAVAGCVAQAEGAEIIRRQPAVDFVLGPQAYHALPELIARRGRERCERIAADFAPQRKFDVLGPHRQSLGVSAYLTVQEGCDKFCTFCVVPYTRGAEFSRPQADIVAEARALVRGGAREITLLGQNVNAYRSSVDLAGLIGALARIEGLERIRYTTSHPRDMSDSLIAAHGEVASLMPYLHLPVQSGADRILRAMNRGHTARDYVRLVERIRTAKPDMALSSDFIVGFPGETDADFAETLALVRDVGYAGAYAFKYSRRPGTPAAAMPGQVDEDVKRERLARLQALLGDQQRAFNAQSVGVVVDVLFEGPGGRDGQMAGRSPWMQTVNCAAAPSVRGAVRRVRVTVAKAHSLIGVVCTEAA